LLEVLRRTKTCPPPEGLAKVCGFRKAYALGNLVDRQGGIHQQARSDGLSGLVGDGLETKAVLWQLPLPGDAKERRALQRGSRDPR
jgi:hypothetical protein